MNSFPPIAPAVRIACLLVFAAALARGHPPAIIFGALLLLISWSVAGVRNARPAMRMLRRLRWLLLSIFVVYGWFTPGAPVAALPLAPTCEGLAEGSQRVAALILIVLAVQLLLHATSRDELFAAVAWMTRAFGATPAIQERLALRVVLTLRACGSAESAVREALRAQPSEEESARPAGRLGAAAARAWREAVQRAHQEPCDEVTLPRAAPPPWWQWLAPAALGLLLWSV